jgi:hypothetical protein
VLLVVVLLYFIAKEACEMRDERRATGSVLGYFTSLQNWLDLTVYGPLFLSLVSYRVVARRAGIPVPTQTHTLPFCDTTASQSRSSLARMSQLINCGPQACYSRRS